MLSVPQLLPPTLGNDVSAVVAVLELLFHTLWSCLSVTLAMPDNVPPMLGNGLSAVRQCLGSLPTFC